MSTAEKLRQKFCKVPPPKDFTWNELIRLMTSFGYRVIEGSGSHKAFYREETDHYIRGIPKPHPGNEVKSFYLVKIRSDLIAEGVLNDE